MRFQDRSSIRTAAATAPLLVGGSVVVSACAEAGGGPSSDMPAAVAEIDLSGLDVEMHFAEG